MGVGVGAALPKPDPTPCPLPAPQGAGVVTSVSAPEREGVCLHHPHLGLAWLARTSGVMPAYLPPQSSSTLSPSLMPHSGRGGGAREGLGHPPLCASGMFALWVGGLQQGPPFLPLLPHPLANGYQGLLLPQSHTPPLGGHEVVDAGWGWTKPFSKEKSKT